MSAFRKAYGESPTLHAVKRMAKVFKELETEVPRAEIESRYIRYCGETPLKFWSPNRFAETFADWKERRSEPRDSYAKGPEGIREQLGH